MSDPVINLHARALEYVWDQARVPTPKQFADWMESHTWAGVDRQWLANMAGRLRAWADDKNYPLIPDDEAMGAFYDDPAVVDRWWEPGALRGDLKFSSLSPAA